MLRVMEKFAGALGVSKVPMFVAAMVVTAAAHAGDIHPTTLRIVVSDGFDSGVFLPEGTVEGEGVYNYRSPRYGGGSGDWIMSWDFNAVPIDAADEAAWMSGGFIVRNDADEDLDFEILIDMPLLEAAAPAAYYGSASLTILRGTISAMPEDMIYGATIDNGHYAGWYEYPYELTGGGSNGDGAPVNGQHEGAEGSIGIRLAFTLSPGARATVQGAWGIQGVGAANRCDGDIDGDGTVTFGDLLRIIANWGPYEGPILPEDLDGNHSVGMEDVFVVILAWGGC